jgi:hypothetical protein
MALYGRSVTETVLKKMAEELRTLMIELKFSQESCQLSNGYLLAPRLPINLEWRAINRVPVDEMVSGLFYCEKVASGSTSRNLILLNSSPSSFNKSTRRLY